MAEPLLSVQGLTVRFDTDRGPVRAVQDVSLDVAPGETVALVGESGSGKSVTALSLLRLVASPGVVESGRILFRGRDLLTLPESDLRRVRGKEISMIFQEPMTSLNPVYTVGAQIVEVIRLHEKIEKKAAKERAIELLSKVGIAGARERVDLFPHQLSGGMRQRVMIAMALACGPSLLVADEPTTALDVSVQAEVLELLSRLQSELQMSVLFITHDLGVVAQVASRVVVMYAGRVMETGAVNRVLSKPEHPYTGGLLASVPPEGSSRSGNRPKRLTAIPGVVPDLAALPVGCRFSPRCALRLSNPPGAERCTETEPELVSLGNGAASRCHFAGGVP